MFPIDLTKCPVFELYFFVFFISNVLFSIMVLVNDQNDTYEIGN